ncbi:MAG TPA: beta-propeller fold lactonase family protein, partial [Rugosimonospora sp.]|nr:beta-propeller fold lactonase family protein [Rugosimonospora sp.]
DGRLTALDSVVTGQAATCWAVLAGGVAYVSNAGSGTLSAYRVDSHGRLTGLGTTATDAGTVDAAVSGDGRYLYVQAGAAGNVDAYRIGRDGSLTPTGSVTVPDAAGAEGIVAP